MELAAVPLRVNLVDLGGASGKEETPRKLMHLLPGGGPAAEVLKAVRMKGNLVYIYYFKDDHQILYADILVCHWYRDDKDKPVRDEAGAVYENIAGLTVNTPGILELAEMTSRQAREFDPNAAITAHEFTVFILQNLPN